MVNEKHKEKLKIVNVFLMANSWKAVREKKQHLLERNQSYLAIVIIHACINNAYAITTEERTHYHIHN